MDNDPNSSESNPPVASSEGVISSGEQGGVQLPEPGTIDSSSVAPEQPAESSSHAEGGDSSSILMDEDAPPQQESKEPDSSDLEADRSLPEGAQGETEGQSSQTAQEEPVNEIHQSVHEQEGAETINEPKPEAAETRKEPSEEVPPASPAAVEEADEDDEEAVIVPEDSAPPAALDDVQHMLETLTLGEESAPESQPEEQIEIPANTEDNGQGTMDEDQHNVESSEAVAEAQEPVKEEPLPAPEEPQTQSERSEEPNPGQEEPQQKPDEPADKCLPPAQPESAMEESYLEKAEKLIDHLEEEVVVVAKDCPIQEAVAVSPIVTVAASASPSAAAREEPQQMLHHIKTIQFKDKKVGIVTQNENGPCPLVAIINVLLLRRQISLSANAEIATAGKLMEHIGNAMLESVPKNLSGEERVNYEQNMMDAMAVLPKLQTGLDVNVKFTGVRDFEYTPECIIFDLLRVPLFHGWLVDPQEKEVVSAIGQAGYNQLVEKVIGQKASIDADKATEALIIEAFLERSASQLTYHGLSELSSSLPDGEIGVLFRNNHFSTIFKHQNELFQLVTDQGFLGEANVVWETLSSIDGESQFVDGHFRTVPPKPEPERVPQASTGSANTSASSGSALHTSMTAEQQIDHDFLVALSLQEEQPASGSAGTNIQEDLPPGREEDRSTQEQLDLELARQLQEEEERNAAEAEAVEREAAAAAAGASSSSGASPGQEQHPSSRSSQSKNKQCTIL